MTRPTALKSRDLRQKRSFDHGRLVRQDEGVTEWDMHADPGARTPADRHVPTGTAVTGVVICHHRFGLGLRIDEYDQYGHVDVPEISADAVAGIQGYPTTGSVIPATVIGYSRMGQLKLSLR